MNINHKYLILFLLLLIATGGCAFKKTPQSVQYTEEEAIPYRIAVLPSEFVVHDSNSTEHKSALIMDDDRRFVADIARSAIANQMAGKGFIPLQMNIVDNKLDDLGQNDEWKELSDKDLCKALQADGLVRTDIYSADMIKALAFDMFQVDAEVRMVNAEGELVGKWRDSASKRRVSVPTGVFALAGTIVEEVFSDPIRRQMRMVIYDWAWNMAQMLPDSPKGTKLPEIIAVDTNVDNRLFAVGKRVTVRVDAEPGLKCFFDIGDFRKNIPLPQTSQGVYEGFYVIREGDKGANEPLVIRLRKANGVDRLWIESGSLITIDGTLPSAPMDIHYRADRDGVHLIWQIPQDNDLDGFTVEKSDTPVSGFEPVIRTNNNSYLDPDIMQGSTSYYRIRSLDKAGNLSAVNGSVKITMPQFDERELSSVLTGTLVKGNYLLTIAATVPEGTSFTIQSGTRIRFENNAGIEVHGNLEASGELSSPVRFLSNSSKGITVYPGGKALISHSEFKGFSNSVSAAGGYCEMRSSVISGGKTALSVNATGNYDFKGLRISGAETGVAISAGNGSLVRSSINNCTVAISVEGGSTIIKNNNLYDNEININSLTGLVVTDNYLGSASAENMRVSGNVLVKSILDAPYPHGRQIILVDDRTVTPEVLEKQFTELKKKGISSFHSQHYGDAYQYLNKAVRIKDDRDIYLYLSYTLLALSDDIALSEVLEEGISKFPYDVRLHQLFVRHLLNKGDIKQARQVLEKALTLSPSDNNLLYMKDYIDHLNAAEEPAKKNDQPDK